MDNPHPSRTNIISSDHIPPSQRSSSSSSLHPEEKSLIPSHSFAPQKRPREPDVEENKNHKDIKKTATKKSDRTNRRDNNNPITTIDMNRGDESSNRSENEEKVVVRGLRLEAIFHPKFDNERNKKGAKSKGKGLGNTKDDVRSIMLQKLGIRSGPKEEARKGTGHLEVSLKHSGSLVLWSGSTRYYSKNSACNEFTRTAEILLRQRFETVRKAIISSTGTNVTDDNDNNQHLYRSYEECSRFVSHNRYTIAFEVVTAEMLGDHGQVPNLDYVVVTAVADRGHERFLSTTEILEFCHQFRLPHNDVWAFFPPSTSTGVGSALSSAETLFQVYDNSLREAGYTENTIQSLTDIADVYIPSPIPHSIFQGSICEGFIVRYVNDDSGDEHAKELREQLEGLAQAARDILQDVPPPKPSSTPAGQTPDPFKSDPVLDIDLRTLYQSISYSDNDESNKSQLQKKPSSTAVALQRQRAALFSRGLKKVLQDGNENEERNNGEIEGNNNDNERQMKRPRRRRQRHDLTKIEKDQKNDRENGEADNSATRTMPLTNDHPLPTLTKDLLESRDKETSRIAKLLQTLDGLKGGAIRYTWMEKYDGGHDESWISTRKTKFQQRKRLYCTIHVCNDSTFFKFQALQSPSDMTLFRGFCVEVMLSSSDTKEEDHVDWGAEEGEYLDREVCNASGGDGRLWKLQSSSTGERVSGAPLMLKMKFLPYMVRTFICRNLLNIIIQKGPEEFERIALGLLEKWKISPDAQECWMPFFRGWALYVLHYTAEHKNRELHIRNETSVNTKADNFADGSNITNPASNGDMILEFGPLTNFSYLQHLEHYTKLYENGEFRTVSSSPASSSPELQTFVCVVSQSNEVSSALANHFANHFNVSENSKSDEISRAESKMIVCSLGEAVKNHRSKSCIAFANIGDLTKGIKKFICDKKVVKRSLLILFGSNKDEIIALTSSTADKSTEEASLPSWIDIPSEVEGKKLVGLWKPWKKFPCAKRFELGRSFVHLEPKREDSTAAVIASMNDAHEIFDAILGVGRSLIEQELKKLSDPSRAGILVFFPGIPGCGKSSLVESSRLKVEEEMDSLKKEKGDLFDRNIHVKEGDKIGKNFWNIVEELLSDDSVMDGRSPALVIADKNAPPASWQKLGRISNDSNSIMLPVLPDSSVLETTTIEGSILPNGMLLPHVSHFYPFSLKYLAVSLSRVLSRPPGEHSGKLDCGFPMACMVVVQFFSFYRYIGADTFQEKLGEKFDKDGAFSIKILEPVYLPFLTAAARDEALPDDLKNLLVEALQLRHGHDNNRKSKVKKEDPQLIDLEKRIRLSIETHKETIRNMTVNLENTEETFAVHIMDRIKSMSNKRDRFVEPLLIDPIQDDNIYNTVKLVSIDIDWVNIHEFLQKHRESLNNFYDSIQLFSSPLPQGTNTEDGDTTMTDANRVTGALNNRDCEAISNSHLPDPNFVECTHITMAFAGEKNSPEALISKFHRLQGREVKIFVTGFLWSSTSAALAIKIASSTTGEDSVPVPACENTFAHVTVWCAPGIKKSLSNQLPNLIESGEAFRVDFDNEDVLMGKISFWNHKNKPFVV